MTFRCGPSDRVVHHFEAHRLGDPARKAAFQGGDFVSKRHDLESIAMRHEFHLRAWRNPRALRTDSGMMIRPLLVRVAMAIDAPANGKEL